MQKRCTNYELLRMIAMFMVMVLHYLIRTDLLPEAGDSLGAGAAGAVIAEAFCIVAVNVYVLISGYFLSVSAFSWKRLGKLLLQVLFYTLAIPPVLVLLGLLPVSVLTDPYHLWNCLFPVQSGHYWFVTAYVVLCLFSPFINAAVWQLEPKRFAQILAGLLLFFSVGKSLSPLQFATDRYGYDYGWFLCVYLIGAWIRRFGFRYLTSLRRSLLAYLGSVCLVAGSELVLLVLSQKVSALTYYASVPFHYNFVPCIVGAVSLFAVFSHVQIPEGIWANGIRFFAPAVFGVYLIHDHPLFREHIMSGSFAHFALMGTGKMIWNIVITVLTIFVTCLAVDWIRCRLFDLLRIRKGAEKLEKKLVGDLFAEK